MINTNINKQELPPEQREALLVVLHNRFEKNRNRHKDIKWANVQARLEVKTEKLRPLYEMERTGGEPDVTGFDKTTGEYIFYDCSAESPAGRRNVCYDRDGQESRKTARPENNAIDMASAIRHRTLNGRRISRITETRRIRYENVELAEDTL